MHLRGTGTFRPVSPGRLRRRSRQGISDCERIEARGALGPARPRAALPVPPARHRRPRPARRACSTRPSTRSPSYDGALPGLGLQPVRARPRRRLAAAARLPVRPAPRPTPLTGRCRRPGVAGYEPMRRRAPRPGHVTRRDSAGRAGPAALARPGGPAATTATRQVRGNQLAGGRHLLRLPVVLPARRAGVRGVGYIVVVFPSAERPCRTRRGRFPRLVGPRPGQIDVTDFAGAKAGAGIIGLLGLLYAGLGWVDALRDALRRVFGTVRAAQRVLARSSDLVRPRTAGPGPAGLARRLAAWRPRPPATPGLVGLDELDRGHRRAQGRSPSRSRCAVTPCCSRSCCPGSPARGRRGGSPVRRPARGGRLRGAQAPRHVPHRPHDANPLYATFGVTVGLLVWINFVSRLLVYAAAWTATQAYSLAPGGIGQPGVGRSTGLAAATDPVRAVAPADYDRAGGRRLGRRVPREDAHGARRPGGCGGRRGTGRVLTRRGSRD